MSHPATRIIGGSHLDVPSSGEYHRWLALRCPVKRRVSLVAHTLMSHQAARITRGLHLNVPSGGATSHPTCNSFTVRSHFSDCHSDEISVD
ncbi:hypothetical protein AVEN_135216-1 [Araneus ventricosus]|uniref:Uncharacterized protein n=1 Tax=Araneus ventricosus TaxID=182803 RepID=A0A4Y2LWM7_ARAVE|nr:hypothetical protein AVEN_135216-1 [Araneus ventricosus]